MELTQISKEEIKLRRKQLSDGNRKYTSALVEIPKSEWPKGHEDFPGSPVEMYRSKNFLVMIYEENNCHRITVARTSINSDGTYKDGITWDELQEIKRWVGFGNKDAIEIYPADKDVVNVANMRHLWVMPGEIGCAWRNKPQEQPKERSMVDLVRAAKREYVTRFGKEPDSMKLVSSVYHQLRGEMKADKVEAFDGMRVTEVEKEAMLGEAEIRFEHDDPCAEDPDFRKLGDGTESNVIPIGDFRKPINPADPD